MKTSLGCTVIAVPLLTLSAGCSTHGALDTSFGTDGIVTTVAGLLEESGLEGIAIQPDGKIVAVGYCKQGPSDTDFVIVRYAPDGSLDPSFGGTGVVTTAVSPVHDEATAVAIQGDGRIVAAGYTNGSGSPQFAVVRYAADGSLDPSFGIGGIVTTSLSPGGDEAWSVVIQGDDKIVVAGSAGNAFGLARYRIDGSLDVTFDGDGIVTTVVAPNSNAFEVVLQPDGKIVAAGSAEGNVALVRYHPDGSLDSAFDGDGLVVTPVSTLNDAAHALLLQPDGALVAAGYRKIATGDDFTLVRYRSDGGLDLSFGSGGIVTTQVAGVDDWIFGIVLQSDGKLIGAGGQNGAGWGDVALARYNADGSLDVSYDADGIVTTHIDHESLANAAALQADGKLVVAGQLLTPGDNGVMLVVRYLE